LIGLYILPLHQIENTKNLQIDDVLCNVERAPLKIGIKFDVSYITPESGPLEGSQFENEEAKSEVILDIPETIVEETEPLRRTYSMQSVKGPRKGLKRRAISFSSTAVKSLGKSLGIRKKLVEEPLLKDEIFEDQKSDIILEMDGSQSDISSHLSTISTMNTDHTENLSETLVVIDKLAKIIESDENDEIITTPVLIKRLSEVYDLMPSQQKAEFYQVAITVIEAQELPGTNLDPFIVIQLDNEKRHTNVKESTSTPYYNEYFAFDFNMQQNLLFDKIITISAYHSRNILRSDKLIGSFKFDIGSIFKQPDHQFYHKWAVLTQPDDLYSPIKGFVKCDIAVIGKGYNVLTSSARDADEDTDPNIVENLMLPPAVSAERPVAKYTINIFRADGLPRFSSGLLTSMKKKLSSVKKELINPYVIVSFAGLTAKTSVRKRTRNPVWNEKITFYELFPPLFQRIKLEIRDNQTGTDSRICTHYLSISSISNEGSEGFLPTFGPSFLHFYGSMLGYDETGKVKESGGDGICYRGRLLLSVSTDILEENEQIPKGQFNIEPVNAVNEAIYGKVKDFLAYVAIYSSTMIPKKYGERKISYEISVGNPLITSHDLTDIPEDDSELKKYLEEAAEDGESVISKAGGSNEDSSKDNFPITDQYKAVSSGKHSYCLPLEDEKPCIYVTTSWPDNRRRVYSANILSQIADNLELGILDVEEMIKMEREGAERRMRGVCEEFLFGCNKYLALTMGSGGSSGGKTKLDKERVRILQRGIERIAKDITGTNLNITKQNLPEKLRLARFYLTKIRETSDDPQHGIPDVFIWMIVGGKKVAYSRLLAKNYLFSLIKDESGKNCGKLHSIYFQVPGKPDYEIVNKLSVYVWYGLLEHKQHFTKGLLRGYENVEEISLADDITIPPPKKLTYTEKHKFSLRVHLYQARSLIASDDSGLSDPYAKVYFIRQCLQTQVINETLSPIWDEMLVFDDTYVYGNKEDLMITIPSVVVEIYDQDKRGTDDFL
ncbi:Otoferlin-like protein, partial [Leptotrombidium deliense]